MLNSHLIGFLALAKERVRLLPFGWHPGTQLLGAYLNSYKNSTAGFRGSNTPPPRMRRNGNKNRHKYNKPIAAI
ncbi:MAG: hypothetical protein KZQ66_09420 [Candidatus Thiodiazotropha sp. (ex Lucinoma aequizonata)]|nr:hypothetical protein [Candidatus Thiodiazotropha sp. (ex Lucinoma aequizonata)]MCU7902187.1 hypothetical protein [Candidatus Thiodiazotropha sp. (ex Lucinoma aequizonata)]